jgi:hypothetical protein
MRCIGLILAVGVLASCSTAPEPTTRSPEGQRDYERLIADKVVAGPPVACLPSYNMDDLVVIDERTIAYRQGAGRIWINNMRSACTGLGRNNALVTRTFGATQTCSGDIARVVDLTAKVVVGSCVFGDFVPYAKPGLR